MENIFSFKRFWLLVRKHANENRTNFLFLIGAMIIAVLFTEFISAFNRLLSNGNEPESVFKMYISFLVLIGGVYSGLFFKNWTHIPRATSVLLLPATALEKIGLILFYSVIVFIPVFTVVFYGSYFALSATLNQTTSFQFITEYQGLSSLPALIIYALLPYIFFQSIFLLFAIWFKKRQIVISFGVIILLFFIVNLLNIGYVHKLSGDSLISYSNYSVIFPADLRYDISDGWRIINSPLIRNVNIMILTTITLLLYMVSYFKYKEKEI